MGSAREERRRSATGGRGGATVKTYRYTVLLEKREEGGYRAHCPGLPRCSVRGATGEEAIRRIRLAIDRRLTTILSAGMPVPPGGDPGT